MKTNVYLGLVIRIITLFTAGMLFSFIPDMLRDFFGDTAHIHEYKVTDYGRYCVKNDISIDEDWDWGARHYWYFWMCMLLFCLSLVNAVISCINLVNKNYKL